MPDVIVPRKAVGDLFEAIQVLPGKKDQLTTFLVAELERNDGILFVEPGGNVADLSPFLIFTLPDKVGWSAYVVAKMGGLQDPVTALQVAFSVYEEDGGVFLKRALVPHPGGGMEVARLDPKTPFANILKKGDLLRSPDLARIGDAGQYVLTVERQGKPFTLELRVLQRPVLKLVGPSAQEAQGVLEAADAAWAANNDKALELYTTVLSRYNGSELLTKERRVQILDRIATLMERKSKGK